MCYSYLTIALIYPFFGFIASIDASPLDWKQYALRSNQRGPMGRKYHASVYDPIRQFLIVFGGLGENETILSDTWVLDMSAGRWYEARNGGHKPEGRYGSVYGMYKDQLILSTGCTFKYCFDDVWSFNVASFLWTRLQVEGVLRPKARGHASGGIYVFGNNFIISGGITTSGEYLSDVYSFDLTQNRWHQLQAWQSTYEPTDPHPVAHQTAAMIEENTLLIFGGCFKHGPCPSAASWTFDLQVSTWNKLKLCPMARSDAAMALMPFNGALYAIMYGGATASRQILASKRKPIHNELAVFDVRGKEWTIRLATGAKSPGPRVGATLASSGQAIYLFGGELEGRFPNDVFILTGDPNTTYATPCGESFFTLVSLHGLLMFLGFAVLLQFGGALAQYSILIQEPLLVNWRYLHKISQTLGLVFVLCAFVCGVAIIPDGHYHFQSVHGALGLFIFLLLIVQAFAGFLSIHYRELRTIILIIHFWLGVSLLLLAYVNISLGLFLAMTPAALWISWFVYVLSVCVVGCFLLAYDCCKKRRLLNRFITPEVEKEQNEMAQQQVGYIPRAMIPFGNHDY